MIHEKSPRDIELPVLTVTSGIGKDLLLKAESLQIGGGVGDKVGEPLEAISRVDKNRWNIQVGSEQFITDSENLQSVIQKTPNAFRYRSGLIYYGVTKPTDKS